MGRPLIVSPSQLATARLCERKWAWRMLDGVKAEPNKFASFGLELHSQAAAWMRDGKAPKLETAEGRAFSAGIQHLPPPGRGEVEYAFNMEREGVTFVAIVDYLEPGLVVDHKSTGGRFIPTEDELRDDDQVNIYAAAAMEFFDEESTEARWVYYHRDGKRSTKRSLPVVTADDVRRYLGEKVDPLAARLVQLRDREARAGDLEPNLSACDLYGGCPYKSLCNLTKEQKLGAMMDKMSLREKLLGKSETTEKVNRLDLPKEVNAPAEPKPEAPKGENPFKKRLGARPGETSGTPAPKPVESATARASAHFGDQTSPITMLLVDAVAVGAPAVPWEDAYADEIAKVCEAADAVHYRAIEFGKGPGYVAAAIRERGACPVPTVTCPRDVPHEILGALQSVCQIVVFGV